MTAQGGGWVLQLLFNSAVGELERGKVSSVSKSLGGVWQVEAGAVLFLAQVSCSGFYLFLGFPHSDLGLSF